MDTNPVTQAGRTAPLDTPWLRYLLLALLPLAVGLTWLAYASPGISSHVPGAAAVTAPAEWADALQAPFPKFLLQLLVVIVCAKSAGWLMRFVGQPPVIGEMVAGIALGPSLFGQWAPLANGWLFPSDSLGGLVLTSQLGVLVFMFAAGVEFEVDRMKGQRRRALLISHAGIALPFVLGLALAVPLYRQYAPATVSFPHFALFVAISLSITAFPVLLRILEDRGYDRLPIGRVAIACAALGDATAWAMLGLIVAAVQSTGLTASAVHLLLAVAFVWLCAARIRAWLASRKIEESAQTRWLLVLVLALLAGGLFTEVIGLHALFGAFIAGLAFSANAGLRQLVRERIQPFATVLLLPLFFASTGLRTRIDLLSGEEWLLCAAITCVATIGKLGGTVLAARVSRMGRADSWRLGALMNTRGLMELIVLGLGYELGLINRSLYAIMVIVAIATTVMTGPLLSLIDRKAGPVDAS